VDLNTIFFGAVAIFSLVLFLYLGKFKASKSQIVRENKINWSNRVNYKGCLIVALGLFLLFFIASSFLL